MATANDSTVALSIIEFLKRKLNGDSFSDDKKESLEVSVMCLQEVFGVDPANADHQSQFGWSVPLEDMFNSDKHSSGDDATQPSEDAETLKAKGNGLMKEGKFNDAIDIYSQAITLDSTNATYFANRAAALMKINKYDEALSDCQDAVRLNPSYAKVHCRMGVIYQKLNEEDKAKECYTKAIELEPDNAEYRSNLASVNPQGSRGGGAGSAPRFDGSSLGNLMNNPMFMNLASTVMSNPAFQNVASSVLQSQVSGGGGGGGVPPGPGGLNIGEMMPQFAQMAQDMQENNPEMFETIRSQAAQFRPNHDDKLPE